MLSLDLVPLHALGVVALGALLEVSGMVLSARALRRMRRRYRRARRTRATRVVAQARDRKLAACRTTGAHRHPFVHGRYRVDLPCTECRMLVVYDTIPAIAARALLMRASTRSPS